LIKEGIDTREKILQVAREEFGKLGLAGARVDRIAQKARVNKAMIYYHFRSKEKLYRAVIDSHMEKIGAFLERSLAEDPDVEVFIAKLAAFYNGIALDRPGFLPIILREIASGGEYVKEALTRIVVGRGLGRKLEKLIEHGIKTGQYRKIDTKQAIVSFWGMNMFYILLAPVINSVWEIADEKRFRDIRPSHVVDLFLYGIKAR